MREAHVADKTGDRWNDNSGLSPVSICGAYAYAKHGPNERTAGKADRIKRNDFPACLLDGTLVLVRIFTILLWNFTIKCVILSNAPASAGFGRFGGDLQIKR